MVFPRGTDPRKTYKWRYLEHFCKRVDEWNISDETGCRMIDAMIQYAKKNKQINKGLALLASDKMLEVGYKAISNEDRMLDLTIQRIDADKNLVYNIDLLSRTGPKSLPSIVKLYIQGRLSTTYLAVSRRCHEAMMQLDSIERSMLPRGHELINIRAKLLGSACTKNKIMMILGDDWRDMC